MSGWTVIEDNHQDRHRRLEFDLDSRKAVLTVTNLLAGNVPAPAYSPAFSSLTTTNSWKPSRQRLGDLF